MKGPSRRLRVRAVAALGLLLAAACERRQPQPEPEPPAAPAAPAAAMPATAAAPAMPTPEHATRAAAERALARLEQVLRPAAGDPHSPWALAHGLLAFGSDYQTRDGRSAVIAAASFAGPRPDGDRGAVRYGFPVAKDGKPVEPHPHLLVKTFLELGVDPTLRFEASDGTALDVRRLIADMRAGVREPATDAQWHDAAWWLAALELDAAARSAPHPDLPRLRAAALARLEADQTVLAAAGAIDPFAASAPMGAAKRGKTHIYGHPCGGLHFVQAVLRGASASGAPDLQARARSQLQRLLYRHQAERALYAQSLRTHPAARLLISGQQLKFFGHLLETLALADELGLLHDDAILRDAVSAARRSAVADVLAAVAQLEAERAYDRLAELSSRQPQLYLDLIGDGCHAVSGLRRTLPLLP